MNLAQLVLERLDRRGSAPALVEPDDLVVSAFALAQSTRALASELGRRGFVPGDRAVLQLANGGVLAVATLAVLAAGGVPVLLEPGLGDAIHAARIAATEARWLVTAPLVRVAGRFPAVRALARLAGTDLPPSPPLPEVVHPAPGGTPAAPRGSGGACPSVSARRPAGRETTRPR